MSPSPDCVGLLIEILGKKGIFTEAEYQKIKEAQQDPAPDSVFAALESISFALDKNQP